MSHTKKCHFSKDASRINTKATWTDLKALLFVRSTRKDWIEHMFLFADSSFVLHRTQTNQQFLLPWEREREHYTYAWVHTTTCVYVSEHMREIHEKPLSSQLVKLPPTLHQHIENAKNDAQPYDRSIWSKSLSRTFRERAKKKESLFGQTVWRRWILKFGSRFHGQEIIIKTKAGNFLINPNFVHFVALFLFSVFVFWSQFLGMRRFDLERGVRRREKIWFCCCCCCLFSEVCKHVCGWWSMVLPWIA